MAQAGEPKVEAGDLFQKVPAKGTTKGPQPTKYDSGFGSEPTSKTQLVCEEPAPTPNPCTPDSTVSAHHQPSLGTINLEPGAHLQQLHQQPPDPGIQEGGTSDEDYGLEETGKAKFSMCEMVCGNIIYVPSHARKVEQNEEYDKLYQATPYDPEQSEFVPGLSGVQELSTDQLVVGNFHHRAPLELVGRPNDVWRNQSVRKTEEKDKNSKKKKLS